ncbi:MAG: hypothetical protein R3E31_20535 [Chloroflexota bacterium]|nr:hypothetical protein [Anaerolineales bacterium]MCA9976657.1 hypothetical protein [Anaerolineales bacterium]MCB8965770.1 hypothetical protein [Ardenticatenaceae bacterium]
MTQQTRYAAYLIRWQEGNSQEQWRAWAENAYTGEKRHFTSKKKLVHFLWQCLNSDTNSAASIMKTNKND